MEYIKKIICNTQAHSLGK